MEEPAAARRQFAADGSGTALPQVVRALRNPNFRLFWSGNFLSNIGTWMQNVAQGWLVLMLTNSAFWLGVVGFAGSIPFLLLHALRRRDRGPREQAPAAAGDANGHDDAGLCAGRRWRGSR